MVDETIILRVGRFGRCSLKSDNNAAAHISFCRSLYRSLVVIFACGLAMSIVANRAFPLVGPRIWNDSLELLTTRCLHSAAD